VAVALSALALVFSWRAPAPPAVPERVLIAIEPAIEDDVLAAFARRLNARLRQDISGSAMQLRPYLDGDLVEGSAAPLGLRRRADALRAATPFRIGTIVLGVVRRTDTGDLLVDSDVLQAPEGRVLYSLSIDGTGLASDSLLTEASERVVGALAVPLGNAPIDLTPIVGVPPTYTAYRHTVEAMRSYAQGVDNGAAAAYIEALRADPGFVFPRLELRTMLALGQGLDQRARARAVLDSLEGVETPMSVVERLHAEWIPADYGGVRDDLWIVGREALTDLGRRAPDRYRSLRAYAEYRAGYLQEAADLLESLDPEHNLVPNYGFVYGEVLHELGRDAEYLEFLNRHEDLRGNANLAFKPLGALGDTARIFDYLEERVRARGPNGAWVARVAARELRCHGHPEAADTVLHWAAGFVDEAVRDDVFSSPIVDLLYMLGDYDRIEELYDRWERGGIDPDGYQLVEGRATLAARRGETREVDRLLSRLGELNPGNDQLVDASTRRIRRILDPATDTVPSGLRAHCADPDGTGTR